MRGWGRVRMGLCATGGCVSCLPWPASPHVAHCPLRRGFPSLWRRGPSLRSPWLSGTASAARSVCLNHCSPSCCCLCFIRSAGFQGRRLENGCGEKRQPFKTKTQHFVNNKNADGVGVNFWEITVIWGISLGYHDSRATHLWGDGGSAHLNRVTCSYSSCNWSTKRAEHNLKCFCFLSSLGCAASNEIWQSNDVYLKFRGHFFWNVLGITVFK